MFSNDLNKDLYKKNNVNTANPLKIVVLLYEAAIKNLDNAEEYLDDFKSYDKATNYLNKSIDIITELRISLDFNKGGKIADNLNALYDFCLEKIKEANLKKEKKTLREAKKILQDLLSAWNQLESQNKKNNGTNPLKGFSISG